VAYEVILAIEAVEYVLRITMACGAKSQVMQASKRIQESKRIQASLKSDPAAEGEFLNEGMYFVDRDPLRAFFTIDVQEMIVEIVNVTWPQNSRRHRTSSRFVGSALMGYSS